MSLSFTYVNNIEPSIAYRKTKIVTDQLASVSRYHSQYYSWYKEIWIREIWIYKFIIIKEGKICKEKDEYTIFFSFACQQKFNRIQNYILLVVMNSWRSLRDEGSFQLKYLVFISIWIRYSNDKNISLYIATYLKSIKIGEELQTFSSQFKDHDL